MAEIINLRRARKRRDKQADEAVAAQNRLSFGRSGVEKRLIEAVTDLSARKLDGHRRAETGPTAVPDRDDG